MKKPAKRTPPEVLTVKEAASALRIGRTKCSHLCLTGVIPSFKLAGQRRIPLAALRRWIESQLDGYSPTDFDREVLRVIEEG